MAGYFSKRDCVGIMQVVVIILLYFSREMDCTLPSVHMITTLVTDDNISDGSMELSCQIEWEILDTLPAILHLKSHRAEKEAQLVLPLSRPDVFIRDMCSTYLTSTNKVGKISLSMQLGKVDENDLGMWTCSAIFHNSTEGVYYDVKHTTIAPYVNATFTAYPSTQRLHVSGIYLDIIDVDSSGSATLGCGVPDNVNNAWTESHVSNYSGVPLKYVSFIFPPIVRRADLYMRSSSSKGVL